MNQQLFDTTRVKSLATASYAIAAMFVLMPLMELGSQLGWTAHPGALNWRTGAVGLLSGATLTPIFGVFIAVLTASVLGHRWVQRGLGVLAILAGLTLLGILVIFALDALQLRPNVAAAMKRSFDLAMIKAVISFTIGIVTLSILAFGALSAARKSPQASAERRAAGSGRDSSLPLVRVSQS